LINPSILTAVSVPCLLKYDRDVFSRQKGHICNYITKLCASDPKSFKINFDHYAKFRSTMLSFVRWSKKWINTTRFVANYLTNVCKIYIFLSVLLCSKLSKMCTGLKITRLATIYNYWEHDSKFKPIKLKLNQWSLIISFTTACRQIIDTIVWRYCSVPLPSECNSFGRIVRTKVDTLL
jgi:hypothetical protein